MASDTDGYCSSCGLFLPENRKEPTLVIENRWCHGLLAFLGPKCPYCGARGSTKHLYSETVGQKRGYGLVTRVDRVLTEGDEDSEDEVTEIERKERVPVIRTSYKLTYQCIKCRTAWDENEEEEEEDFEDDEREKVVVEREVLRIPCNHCGSLIDPIRNGTCPKCGAPILSR